MLGVQSLQSCASAVKLRGLRRISSHHGSLQHTHQPLWSVPERQDAMARAISMLANFATSTNEVAHDVHAAKDLPSRHRSHKAVLRFDICITTNSPFEEPMGNQQRCVRKE